VVILIAEEALFIYRAFPATIHAGLSGLKMNALELREQILAERPGTKVLLTSGHQDVPLPSNLAFLAQPFGPAVLKDRIRQL
jgi:hypothetical protein